MFRVFKKIHKKWHTSISQVPLRRVHRKRVGAFRHNRARYDSDKEIARIRVHELLTQWGPVIGVRWKRVSIKAHRSRWGSCSAAGNLNFNFRIIDLSAPLAEYVVVHELCHLRHLDHSSAFWAAVARVMPDYNTRRAALSRWTRLHALHPNPPPVA